MRAPDGSDSAERRGLGRIPALDGLRGIAALVVLIHHTLLTVPTLADSYLGRITPQGTNLDWLIYSPLHLAWAGTEAVFIFFVLSGLVVALPALRTGFDWAAYYPSRLLRLYLPVFAAVAFAFVLETLIPRAPRPAISLWLLQHAETVSPITAVKDAALLLGVSFLDSPLWSLRWEVVFSLLLPLYVWVARRLTRFAIPMVIACALAAGIGNLLAVTALFYLPVFLIGTIAAVRLADLRAWAGRISRRTWAVLTGLAGLGLRSYWPLLWFGSNSTARLALPVVILSAAALVIVAVGWPSARAVLSTRTVRWLGRVSFSLYLTHEPIVVSVSYVLPPSFRWVALLVAPPVALIASEVFFRVVESPAHRLAQQVKASISARRETPSSSTSPRTRT